MATGKSEGAPAATRRGGDKAVVRTVLDEAEAHLKPVLAAAFGFSFVISMLGYSMPLYMINVYDRVLSSRNETTLIVLSVVIAYAVLMQNVFEALRADMLRRAAVKFDRTLSAELFDVIQRTITRRPMDPTVPSLRDLDALRNFLTSTGLAALIEAPFFVVFIIVCYIIHPLYAGLVFATTAVLVALNMLTARATVEPTQEGDKAQRIAGRRAAMAFKNLDVVQSMGMRPALRRNWLEAHEAALGWTIAGDDRTVFYRVLSGFARQISHSAAIGLGGFLVLHDQISPGILFVASIVVGKASSPLMQIAGSWRTILTARDAERRIRNLLAEAPREGAKMDLRPPKGHLAVRDLILTPPGKGSEQVILHNLSFEVPAGSILAIIGPSAAGKTSLLRAILGVWRPLRGEVRIDGTEISHWNDEMLGRHLGYLPQSVDLFPGTVEQNVARFTDASHVAVLEAAEMAGAHEVIQRLPEGYNTQIGGEAQNLSGGQRQRIGLARALFGRPALVVLDEPNANLDAAGEEALVAAIGRMRQQGTTVVFVTHKANLLNIADYVLVIGDRTMKNFGPREDVMRQVAQPRVVQMRSIGRAAADGQD